MTESSALCSIHQNTLGTLYLSHAKAYCEFDAEYGNFFNKPSICVHSY